MTKDQIIKRRDDLVADRAKALEDMQALDRMRHTQYGAIQEAEHWLRVLAAEEETARLAAEKGGECGGLSIVRGEPLDEIVNEIAQREARAAVQEAAAG